MHKASKPIDYDSDYEHQGRSYGAKDQMHGPGTDVDSEAPLMGQGARSVTSGKASLSTAVSSWVAVGTGFLSRRLRRGRSTTTTDSSKIQMRKKREVKAKNRSETAFNQMFEALDQNDDGKIDRRELKRLMDGLGMRVKQRDVDRVFSRADRDGDGLITSGDFKMDWINRWQESNDRKALINGLFKLLDVTADGVIEQKEVKMVMMSIGEKVSNQEIEEMFRIFDKNLSGGIDIDEFTTAMEKHVNKIMPKGADLLRILAEGQSRAARVQAEIEGERLLALPPYIADEDDTNAVKITTV